MTACDPVYVVDVLLHVCTLGQDQKVCQGFFFILAKCRFSL